MRRIALALAAALCATPAAAATHWTVDPAKSKLGFTVRWSGEAFTASFKTWSADITFDPTDLAHSKAVVKIDIASETSAFPENDEGIKGAQGMEASKFPAATFQTTKFTHGKGNDYVVEGTLSLHGVTKAVTLPFTLAISGRTAHMVGTAALTRPDFGLARGEFTGDAPIGHAVTVNVDLTATKP